MVGELRTPEIFEGDCLEVMAGFEDCSVDAVVTDPPYGLGFMGKAWDRVGLERRTAVQRNSILPAGGQAAFEWKPNAYQEWCTTWASEALRVAKPGAHLLAFGGTRTYHRLACAIEDAGWEIRDCLVWAYASGFPKSLDVAKAMNKAAGYWRGRAGPIVIADQPAKGTEYERTPKGEPVTEAAETWQGWGTALKPAWEPILMARKPLRGTVAANVAAYGTGALNIDATRLAVAEAEPNRRITPSIAEPGLYGVTGHDGTLKEGRWPANVILTDPIFDGDTPGVVGGGEGRSSGVYEAVVRGERSGPASIPLGNGPQYADSGTYSRFFLLPRAGRSGMPSGRMGACQTCGAPIAEPTSTARNQPPDIAPPTAVILPSGQLDQLAFDADGPSPSLATATAPSLAPTPLDGMPGSMGSEGDLDTESGMSAIGQSNLLEELPATEFHSDLPARTAEQPPTSTGTTTTIPSPSLCERCADDAIHGRTLPQPKRTRPALPVDGDDYTRFLIIPKADRAEREPVLGGLDKRVVKIGGQEGHKINPMTGRAVVDPPRANTHPTVKPVELMRHLIRLVTPSGGIVLDPFLGSGTTAIAAEMEGFPWIGIEKEAEYVAIARARLLGTQRGLGLFHRSRLEPDEALL